MRESQGLAGEFRRVSSAFQGVSLSLKSISGDSKRPLGRFKSSQGLQGELQAVPGVFHFRVFSGASGVLREPKGAKRVPVELQEVLRDPRRAQGRFMGPEKVQVNMRPQESFRGSQVVSGVFQLQG